MKKLCLLLLLCFLSCLKLFAQDNSNLLLGNPTNAKTVPDSLTNYLYDQSYFIESYNGKKNEPNWVAWHLNSQDFVVDGIRLNNFRYDYALPPFFYKVEAKDYSKSGFDKGHHCNSEDRSRTRAANSATFVMTNMIPQCPNNNRIMWAHLEEYTRHLIVQGNMEAYIYMGSYGTGGTGEKGFRNFLIGSNSNKINVPAHIWKVIVLIPNGDNDLLRTTADAIVIAVDSPNDNSLNTDWHTYITNVYAIEKVTGDHFFTNLNILTSTILKAKTYVDPSVIAKK